MYYVLPYVYVNKYYHNASTIAQDSDLRCHITIIRLFIINRKLRYTPKNVLYMLHENLQLHEQPER